MVFLKGRFLPGFRLHPAAFWLLWLMLVVFLQLTDLAGMAMVAALLLFSGHKVRGHWRRLLCRTLVLLLTLFLVFAYAAPRPEMAGWRGFFPGRDGLIEASLHVCRLVALLGALAWLSASLEARAMMSGLWFLLRPLQRLGLPLDRSVVRLSLTLEDLDQRPPRLGWNAWKEEWISCERAGAMGRRVQLELPPWRALDSVMVLAAAALLVGGTLWRGSL